MKVIIRKSINGGRADKIACADLAKKYNVPVEKMQDKLQTGITVEMEHTDRRSQAREIAMDHLSEQIDYYDKLEAAGLADELEKSVKDLSYWKKKLMSVLSGDKISKSIIISSLLRKGKAYPIGTKRTWNGKDYKKVPGGPSGKGKWMRTYSGKDDRGERQAVRNVMKKIQGASSMEELSEIVSQNMSRFKDDSGKTLPIVKDFMTAARGTESGKKTAKEKTWQEKEVDAKEKIEKEILPMLTNVKLSKNKNKVEFTYKGGAHVLTEHGVLAGKTKVNGKSRYGYGSKLGEELDHREHGALKNLFSAGYDRERQREIYAIPESVSDKKESPGRPAQAVRDVIGSKTYSSFEASALKDTILGTGGYSTIDEISKVEENVKKIREEAKVNPKNRDAYEGMMYLIAEAKNKIGEPLKSWKDTPDKEKMKDITDYFVQRIQGEKLEGEQNRLRMLYSKIKMSPELPPVQMMDKDMKSWMSERYDLGQEKKEPLKEPKAEPVIQEDSPEIAEAKNKIRILQKKQKQMKDVNKIAKKKNVSDEEKIKQLVSELGLKESTAKLVMKPDYMGRTGFASFELTNNNAKIKAAINKITDLERRAEQKETFKPIEFDGGSIDIQDDRVVIDHDVKPDRDVIQKLKGRGFRWTPSIGAWTRKHTRQAVYDAKDVLGLQKSRIIIRGESLQKAKYITKKMINGKWVYKYQEEKGKPGATNAPDLSISPDKFDAGSYFTKTDDPMVTAESIMAKASPELRAKIAATEAKLKKITPTINNHRTSGEGAAAVYTPERQKIHESIIMKMLSPEKIAKAMPEPGKSPTFTMLGGRGGCLSLDHEYLTDGGWKKISEYKAEDRVLVFDPETNSTRLEVPERYVDLPCDNFYHIKSRGVDLMVSEEHTILHSKKFNPEKWRTIKALDLVEKDSKLKDGWDGMIPCSFPAPDDMEGINLTDDELRLMVAVCADGNYSLETTNNCRISIRKERKKERLEMLLRSCEIDYKIYHNPNRPTEDRYSFYAPENNKTLSSYWKANSHQLAIIAEEVIKWDGWTDKYKAWVFCSTKKEDIDFVSYVFNTQGRRSSFYRDDREGTGWSPIWRVSAGVNRGFAGLRGGGPDSGISTVPSVDGRKYCFTVSTGYFITRRNDCICITGNSGKSWFNGKVYDPDKTIVMDSDEIKGQLPEYEGWNAFEVHEESSDILEKAVAMAKSYGLNIVIDATMKTTSSAVDRVLDFKKSGYNIKAHYMHAPRQVSAKRAVSRFNGSSGRYVPVGVVLSNVSNEKTFDAVKKYASSWSFHDSSGNPPPALISKKNGALNLAKAIESSKESKKQDPYDMYDFGPITDPKDYSEDLKRMIEKNRPGRIKKSRIVVRGNSSKK